MSVHRAGFHCTLKWWELFVTQLRGLGVPVTPLGRPSFQQTTYNIQVAKTPWQHLGSKSHCWKAHFFKICFFVKHFRQQLVFSQYGPHAALIRLSPLIHKEEQWWVASVTPPPPLWKILATPLTQLIFLTLLVYGSRPLAASHSTFTLAHGSFVPRELLAAKGLLKWILATPFHWGSVGPYWMQATKMVVHFGQNNFSHRGPIYYLS